MRKQRNFTEFSIFSNDRGELIEELFKYVCGIAIIATHHGAY